MIRRILRSIHRRLFPGRYWTQAEVDDIQRAAHERWLDFQKYVE